MSSPSTVEGVALLTALQSGVSEIAVELIADIDPQVLSVLAIAYGHLVLEAWRKLAIACEADPDDYISARLAQMGAEVAVT